MRHLKKGRKFGRRRGQRRALMAVLLNNFIITGRIMTTEAKAKELRPLIEKTITRAKKDTVFNRRFLARILNPKQAKKIFEEIGPRYLERKGGYTRIIKLERRKKGDASPMAIIELI